MRPPTVWVLTPDVDRPIGGVRQHYRLVDVLHRGSDQFVETGARLRTATTGPNPLTIAAAAAAEGVDAKAHIAEGLKSGALKPFPRLRSFRMKFDHARHMNLGDVSCATCHRPARGGVAMTIPAGFNAHTTCYRCHTPRAQSAGRDISSCGTCHQLGRYSRTPQFMQAFRVGFSHAKHGQMTCNECHQVRAGMPQRRQVTNPEPLNHHATGRGQSCLTCHDGKRAFGGDDFSACKRCHTGTTWHF